MNAILEYFNRIATYNPLIVFIELLLIGLVVYWAVNFLEGTRGERLFRGIIILLLAGSMILKLVIARFDFARLQYLYGFFLILVLIIAVAAFQPEIRRMLIRIGQAGSFGGSSHHQLAQTVEEIISAVNALAEKRVGAIIVLERRVALGEFTEMGIKIDSKVKSALLKTIFYPGTALHDLAVVIHGDRIVAARVQLPLAESSFAGGALGSRHRAAMGITTGSDAVAIVVSEETGTVSIAEDGRLDRHITEEELRKRLTSIIIDAEPMQPKPHKDIEDRKEPDHISHGA
ncbi:MAG: diadenylate cyclase CdaA [Planctomycetes bacterium]|nr:diadenylate cyclase CdaA [Planctomycetota bacterium]MBU1518974.1 diadenylate cyclase CdaA [Planctomycetota bacterium]MBU2457473.1 diadenylate cyclase CdaA [Planctomycetota bacterium]MBU2596528.1 diadenylate cyclase CdaA [Planctomycetota bacterium]